MNYNLALFEEQYELGYLRKSEKDGLVLYGYTDKCTFDRAWNDINRMARGIIFEKATGKLVAKPFPKFFNLGEMEETFFDNLPKASYEAFEKADGSLGIIYHYGGKWNVATRGSLGSEQAVKGAELLKKYETRLMFEQFTYLVEIVYPENKIVVDYGNEEKLVLLGAYLLDKSREVEIDRGIIEAHGADIGMPVAKKYDYTIEQMIELKKTLPKDEEGFVVRFENGLRVKIKGDEYMKIAKIISQMSPLAFWEAMSHGVVNKEYLAQVPEEFRGEFEPMVTALESAYATVMSEIGEDLRNLPMVDIKTKDGQKTIGLILQNKVEEWRKIKHASAMFPALLHKAEALEKYIMKQIRPTGNVMVSE